MRYFLIVFIFFALAGCISHSGIMPAKAEGAYNVTLIDSVDNYYIIYAGYKDHTYKIVSEKTGNHSCDNIAVGKSFNFILRNLTNRLVPPLGNPSFRPVNYLDISSCITFGINTEICTSNSTDIATAENVQGLCFNPLYGN